MDNYYLDYFYGLEADAYSFIRVPKLLINLPIYKDLTSDDKLLYRILLDRMSLSAKNRWMDDDGRVYIIFTIEDVMEALNCAQHKAVKLMNNLETKAHLIERKRQGQGKPSLIYVKKFVPMSNAQFLNCQNRKSGIAESTIQELPKPQCNNTESNNTEYSDTDLFFSADSRSEEMRTRISYEEYFRDALEIDFLKQNNPGERDTLDGILDLIVDTCCANKPWILISGDRKPIEVVKSRFMKLNSSHIEYVLKCLSDNTTRIRNVNQYLLATLFNAPTTISPYYRSWVNNDMANGLV